MSGCDLGWVTLAFVAVSSAIVGYTACWTVEWKRHGEPQ